MARPCVLPVAVPSGFGGRYQGRVAVVTGASAGLGAQLCRDLARAGATVVGLARNAERLDKPWRPSCARFARRRRRCTCDVADTTALRRALDEVAATPGPIDLLVNNAAQDPGVRLVDIAEEDFRHTFDVNFFAPVAATLAVMPAMVERGAAPSSTSPPTAGGCPPRARAPTPRRRRRCRPSPSPSRSAWAPRASTSTSSTPPSWPPSSGWARSGAACAGPPG